VHFVGLSVVSFLLTFSYLLCYSVLFYGCTEQLQFHSNFIRQQSVGFHWWTISASLKNCVRRASTESQCIHVQTGLECVTQLPEMYSTAGIANGQFYAVEKAELFLCKSRRHTEGVEA
jgi:hypothetical protein